MVATILGLAGLLNHRRSVLALGSGGMIPYLNNRNWLQRFWVRLVLKLCGMVIVKTSDAFKIIKSYGVPEERLRLTPAYSGGLSHRFDLLPSEIQSFYERHHPIIVSSVSFLPEYGVELTLDTVGRLRADYPKIGLVFAGADKGKETSLKEIQSRGLSEHVCLAGPQPREAYLALVARGTLFLRATTFDGDASSVREAIALGIPAVASRTDFRPKGSTLFEIGNLDDLLSRLRQVIGEPAKHVPVACDRQPLEVDRLETILGIYRDVLLLSGTSHEQLPSILQSGQGTAGSANTATIHRKGPAIGSSLRPIWRQLWSAMTLQRRPGNPLNAL